MLSVSGDDGTGGWRCGCALCVLRVAKVMKIGSRDRENELKFDVM
jgi:hypothetical protein